MATSVSHGVDSNRMSPVPSSKLNTRQSFAVKTPSLEKNDALPSLKVDTLKSLGISIPQTVTEHRPVLRKNSQSESALDAVFQQAQQAETESGQEENVSTDSSLPSNDKETRQPRKKQRFQFPSFVKRNKNKT